METILQLTLILFLAELFEAYIQYAPTLLGVIKKLYHYYHKNIFLFFLIQPSFYIVLFIVLFTGILNIAMVSILAIKIFDIFYKLELIKKLFVQRKISVQTAQMISMKIPSYFFLFGAILYPLTLFYALL